MAIQLMSCEGFKFLKPTKAMELTGIILFYKINIKISYETGRLLKQKRWQLKPKRRPIIDTTFDYC